MLTSLQESASATDKKGTLLCLSRPAASSARHPTSCVKTFSYSAIIPFLPFLPPPPSVLLFPSSYKQSVLLVCRTLAMVKPDAVQHLGSIVDAVLQSGFILR